MFELVDGVGLSDACLEESSCGGAGGVGPNGKAPIGAPEKVPGARGCSVVNYIFGCG